ncbi:hypothetical protein I862_07225 [endosymbiont of Acanthamoeba sp. UWC8]|uniref:lysylphosphatidylglycerol synthase transmembrane domain-containing protein n=1 Tax=endosymbiont of Acanthamoeba sp. UWC8 TaxID=86106 RepID=UPI0004D0CE23|nr:lysylphosphatidylglycerol synthase transmembrane domain-containing protein [endosymbiont of Acanthamoeba sp. UWC8]AIF81999.1 hypothetical protein I862_07225 [endosymbiont of Acanthamoeba sp. UWC8]
MLKILLSTNLKKYFIIIIKLSVCITAFYLVLGKLDISKLFVYLKNADIALLVVAIIASHLSLILSSLRSKFYFKQYGLTLPVIFTVSLYYLGTFYNILLPGGIGGDGYKVYLLSKLEKFPKLGSLRIILYERVNGFYILVLFGLILVLFSDFLHKIPYLKLLTWLCIILITPCYLLGVKYILRDNIGAALRATIFSFFVQLFQVVMVLLIILALNQSLSYNQIINFIVLFIVASIVAILPISIGGAGLRELTFLYGIGLINPELEEIGVTIALVAFAIYIITSLPGAFFITNIEKTYNRI